MGRGGDKARAVASDGRIAAPRQRQLQVPVRDRPRPHPEDRPGSVRGGPTRETAAGTSANRSESKALEPLDRAVAGIATATVRRRDRGPDLRELAVREAGRSAGLGAHCEQRRSDPRSDRGTSLAPDGERRGVGSDHPSRRVPGSRGWFSGIGSRGPQGRHRCDSRLAVVSVAESRRQRTCGSLRLQVQLFPEKHDSRCAHPHGCQRRRAGWV